MTKKNQIPTPLFLQKIKKKIPVPALTTTKFKSRIHHECDTTSRFAYKFAMLKIIKL